MIDILMGSNLPYVAVTGQTDRLREKVMKRNLLKIFITGLAASCGFGAPAAAMLGSWLTYEDTEAAEVVVAIERKALAKRGLRGLGATLRTDGTGYSILDEGRALRGEAAFPIKVTGDIRSWNSARMTLLFLKKHPEIPGLFVAVNRVDSCLETSAAIDFIALKKPGENIVDEFLKQAVPVETDLDLLAGQTRILRDAPLEVRRFCWEKIRRLPEEQRLVRALPYLSIGLHAEGPAAFQFIPKTGWSVSNIGKKGTATETWSEMGRTDISSWAYRNGDPDMVTPILEFTEVQEGGFRSRLLRAVAGACETRHVPKLLEFLSGAESNQELWSAYYSIRQAIDERTRTPAADGLKAEKTKYLSELSKMLETRGIEMPPVKLWPQS